MYRLLALIEIVIAGWLALAESDYQRSIAFLLIAVIFALWEINATLEGAPR